MGTLQKLKAYFGMVPAEDFDEYDADDYDARDYGKYGHRPSYLSDEDDYEPQPSRRRSLHEPEEEYQPPASRNRSRPVWATDSPPAPVHGALAVETRREPVSRVRTEPRPEPVAPSSYPLGRIVTLHPTSYNEARTIGEHYREGTPVIMNLTEMDDADAKRLVDFAAGLAFALRGSIDKVTNKVFLISPPNVDPSAEDKRRIAEGGLLTRG
ncbi:MAG TPA: cell division protein SepF [Actinophytocola sp.]|jgi:cell division inhibitor SepF|uniref:cell division protein SepF n=1 Tax=Actinophytocola sp. TaxID=1872138 RepID=UPI002E0218F8|nr:cell division protein SepF [Actinophytocola sp.]